MLGRRRGRSSAAAKGRGGGVEDARFPKPPSPAFVGAMCVALPFATLWLKYGQREATYWITGSHRRKEPPTTGMTK